MFQSFDEVNFWNFMAWLSHAFFFCFCFLRSFVTPMVPKFHLIYIHSDVMIAKKAMKLSYVMNVLQKVLNIKHTCKHTFSLLSLLFRAFYLFVCLCVSAHVLPILCRCSSINYILLLTILSFEVEIISLFLPCSELFLLNPILSDSGHCDF